MTKENLENVLRSLRFDVPANEAPDNEMFGRLAVFWYRYYQVEKLLRLLLPCYDLKSSEEWEGKKEFFFPGTA